ncbi:MAG: nucleotidyl transferase AbiEii/AbiGii toxin family protein [Desulfobacterales bacterium]|jgi:predicted nucleotidyltransferase
MTNTLLDLSGKIDKIKVSALGRIHKITSSMSIPFFVVGATARDILLEVHYGIGSKRATVDIDIAVFIEKWERFKHLKDELIGGTDFTPTRDIPRLLFKKRLPVDIVPFGGVAEKGDFIEWPPDGSFKMSVMGFRECYQHAVQVKISDKPKLSVNVVSLAGLSILKLISWHENSARRRKDASDLVFIIRNYLDAGNLERLFEDAPDIVDSGDYDYEAGSARLLGRDISRIAFTTTKAKLIKILKKESRRKQGHRIAMDVLQGRRLAEESYEDVSALFDALLKGLTDDKNR